jgi:hypothetical protein
MSHFKNAIRVLISADGEEEKHVLQSQLVRKELPSDDETFPYI